MSKNRYENNRYFEEEKDEKKIDDDQSSEKNEETAEDSKNVDELIAQYEQQISTLKNDYLKAKADEINYKKRVDEEKNRIIKYANQSLLEKLIEQIDLFDQVVNMPTEDPVLKNYLLGFTMINNNFKSILSDEGVKKIIVKVGEKMDPKYHQALQVENDENYEDDVIIGELKCGYLYKDRILRPTLVKVNKINKKEGNENE